uniref:Transmembrane and coiled-coil domain family 1b n=1 Tax=Mastacembelus armatus TaxID=205130 RepID=A0A3Q3N6H1_9TELE
MPGGFSQDTQTAAMESKPRQTPGLICRSGSSRNSAALNETQVHEVVGPGGSKTLGTCPLQSSLKYGSEDDDCSSTPAGSVGRPSGSTSDHTLASGFDALLGEIQELFEKQGQLQEDFENLKALYQQNYNTTVEVLQEERCRCELLDEQLNDLTELHQNEILILKEELAGMEEKITYQSSVRAKDIHVALEACQTRISKLELQQQQVVHLEGLENAKVQTLLGRSINVLLAVMAVLLVFVSTVANCVVPLMKTSGRILATLFFLVVLCLWRNWDAVLEYHFQFFCTQHPAKVNKM